MLRWSSVRLMNTVMKCKVTYKLKKQPLKEYYVICSQVHQHATLVTDIYHTSTAISCGSSTWQGEHLHKTHANIKFTVLWMPPKPSSKHSTFKFWGHFRLHVNKNEISWQTSGICIITKPLVTRHLQQSNDKRTNAITANPNSTFLISTSVITKCAQIWTSSVKVSSWIIWRQ